MKKLKKLLEQPLLRQRHNPLNDYLFYKIMGEKGDEVQLLGFLNAVLGKTGADCFTSVTIIENKSFTPKVIGDKASILDVRAVLQSKTRVNIEVQIRNQHNMDKRSLYYSSREFVKGIKSGQDYNALPDVIAVNIVDFEFLPTKGFHSCFHLREDSEPDIILTKSLEIHFLDMVKYRRAVRKGIVNDPLSRWMAWFNEKSPPELLAEVVKMDSAIQVADERMVYVTGDDEAIRAYEMRQMGLCDLVGIANYARDEGRTEGMAKGMRKSTLEIARNLKKVGLSITQIADGTGLSIEVIEQM
ncbi:MAG: Rpn family recombination-promoting nuclease/putative transposase [Treponema sp.]|jgi:predicted transposase/invertase (TIGR01784 family)|nr:Rpn family recombination-promoting nuclease/putative transposase [Treponema sp.]